MRTHKINDIQVVDAKRSIMVEITKGDIARGDTKDPAACAASLACRRKFHIKEARIHRGRAYLLMGKRWVRYVVSQALKQEIIAFDRGGAMAPGTYLLRAIPPQERYGARKNKPIGKTAGKRGKKKRLYHYVPNIRPVGANV